MARPIPGNVEEIGNQSTTDVGVMMGGQYKFARHGESGMWMADVLPHTAAMADDICLINSMWTDHPNHDNALYKIHSGRLFMGYPTLGAWTVYGLGSENQNLPAYVVLNDPLGLPKNGTRNWTSGFLPPVYQGTPFRPTGSPILQLAAALRAAFAGDRIGPGLACDNWMKFTAADRPFYPELDARIESYGLAARMQLSAGEALDLSRESARDVGDVWNRRKDDRFVWASVVCWPDDWSSGVCGSCRSFLKSNLGIAMSISMRTTVPPASVPTSRLLVCCAT